MADALATLLVQEGAVSLEDVALAQTRQREAGGSLDTALLELDLIGEARLLPFLARASGLAPAPAEALREPDPRSRRVFPAKVAERHGLAPFALEGKELKLVASWPVDPAALDEIGFMLSMALAPHVALELRVREVWQRVYEIPLPPRYAALAAKLAQAAPEPAAEAPETAAARPSAPAGEEAPAAPPGPAPELRPELAAAVAQALEVARAELEPEPERPPPPVARGARWTLAEARSALAAAADRDQAVAVALRYARDFFEHAAVLSVSRRGLHGYDASADDPRARGRARALSVPLPEVGIFKAVLDSAGPYLGPPGGDAALLAVLRGLGREAPRTVLLYPVVVRERVVCLLCADNGEAPVSPRRLGDLLLLAGSLGRAFERILRGGRHPAGPEPVRLRPATTAADGAGDDGGGWEITEPGRVELPEPPPLPGTEPEFGEFEVTHVRDALVAPPPFDGAEAVRRLLRSARGSEERGRLVALMVQNGPEVAGTLAEALPGPLDPAAAGDEEAVAVDERGPVPIALAAMGTVATPYLLPLLGDPDPRRRRTAAELLGHGKDPAGFLSLADAALDPDPGVAGAALSALAALRGHADFGAVLERLHRVMTAPGPSRVEAVRALQRLGDGTAVPLLIAQLSAEPALAEAAAAALAGLTAQHLGKDQAAWTTWWTGHRGQPRLDWLFEALADGDREVRIAAAEALRAAGPSPTRYLADAPEAERIQAAREWRAWFDAHGLVP